MHNIPLATNLASSEAILHLMAEHPEALARHPVKQLVIKGSKKLGK